MMDKQKVVDGLMEVRDLISDPEHWTCGAYARDQYGELAAQGSTFAYSWCLDGALTKVALHNNNLLYEQMNCALRYMAYEQHGTHYIKVNDLMGHAATMNLIDDTIKALKDTL